jgi:multimeric flavodoxin WrbA
MNIFRISQKKKKVIIFQGSPRNEKSCANMSSKTHKVVEFILKHYGDVLDIEVVDLSVDVENGIIQPCKGCYSTAGGFHCHWACSCFNKGDGTKDILSEQDIYTKLEKCDAFLIFSPIHWHNLTSQIKSLFDRLVCCNLTITQEDAKKIMGKEIKNKEITGKFAVSKKYEHLRKNHLEGKICGFYIHGDDGADDYPDNEFPDTFEKSDEKIYRDAKICAMPYILQCKYSGIKVPDSLVKAFYINKNVNYYTANLKFGENGVFFDKATEIMEDLLKELV